MWAPGASFGGANMGAWCIMWTRLCSLNSRNQLHRIP
uniref:Uncharacterized protein n=1 Tax=Anguilla anguilla TaxID=7936 RepID=A0A0E9VBS7_ANGAN